ncbi:MAG: molybdopterin-binding protein [Conexivisphaerales archaeon]
MTEVFTCEIVCIGNELLTGRTVNSNAQWLGKSIYQLGGIVKRITVAPDIVSEIKQVVKEVLARRPDWIIITGGLGPTYDDVTLAAVAEATGRKLSFSEEAMKMIITSVNRRGVSVAGKDVDAARRKMATIPEDSEPLPNEVGTAPGVLLSVDKTHIVCLPGVPVEMQSIFESSVMPKISAKLPAKTTDIEVIGVPEAVMAPFLAELASSHPELYIKSHPQSHVGQSKVIIQVTGRGESGVRNVESVSALIASKMKEMHGICKVKEAN